MPRNTRTRLLAVAIALALFSPPQVLSPPEVLGAEAEQIAYETHIRPILKEHCFHCHGEAKSIAGGLDLRMRRLMVAGGDSGAAIEPGDAEASLLFSYVEAGEMPPQDELKLTADQVAVIGRWIDEGAPTVSTEPDVTPEPGEILITQQERSHWAFQPIEPPSLPRADAPEMQSDNPIDAFVARRLSENGLTFSGEADKLTLIKRAAFDLLGLPPEPHEIEAFLADQSPRAYEKLIDRLLASPQYGQRWARHWLDVAGYADSEGYDDEDVVRPDAWIYRDYVVRSLNQDKPWNQFIVEQLAGDELVQATQPNAEQLANQDPQKREKLAATGFLRMAPDGTASNPRDAEAKNQVIAETIQIVSSSLLGLTVGCAECHHHRYDPIPQQDFYRLRAVFEPVFDCDNWRAPANRRAALWSQSERARAAELEEQAKQLDAKHDELKQEVVRIVRDRVLEDIPTEQRDEAREAFETPVAERTAEQKQLLEDRYPMLNLLRPGRLHLFLARYEDGNELKERYEKVQTEAAELRAKKPQPDYVRLATEDPEHVPETHVFHRGDFTAPEPETIPPGGLSVLAAGRENTFAADDPRLPTTGRRLAFARYLTDPAHPLVARVLVNRFWMHHFGQGLVDSPGDFGTRSNPPSHPELLDWLANDFVQNGWRLKRLHKLIMTSRTYRQSSQRRSDAEAIDAENRWFWRMPVRRLEAEVVRDAILAVSGQLDRRLDGPPVPVELDDAGIITLASGDDAAQRRSLYVQVRRTEPAAMLEAFDAPQMQPNCERRVSSTVPTQSLSLMNSQFVLRQARAFAERVLAQTGDGARARDQIVHAWKLALGGPPDSQETQKLLAFLKAQTEDFRNRKVDDPEEQALASLCQVLFGTNQFLYVD